MTRIEKHKEKVSYHLKEIAKILYKRLKKWGVEILKETKRLIKLIADKRRNHKVAKYEKYIERNKRHV